VRHGPHAVSRSSARPVGVPPRPARGPLGRRLGQYRARASIRHACQCIIDQYSPERAAIGARYFSLGNAGLLRSRFTATGFRDIGTFTETRRYPFPSFGAYFKSIEEGQGPAGQAYTALPVAVQQLVREDVRRQLEGNAATGGPVEVEVELLFGCGRR
jgi:hypothetical protein